MERLYNNIQLPDVRPPKNKETTLDQPLEVPYLSQRPDTIDIRVGRQLFVDDFLIAETDLVRVEGKPETQPQPLLQPETNLQNVVSGRLVRWQHLCGKQGWPALETFA